MYTKKPIQEWCSEQQKLEIGNNPNFHRQYSQWTNKLFSHSGRLHSKENEQNIGQYSNIQESHQRCQAKEYV